MLVPPDVCVRFTYFVSLSIKGSQTLNLECVCKITLFTVRNNLRMLIMFQCMLSGCPIFSTLKFVDFRKMSVFTLSDWLSYDIFAKIYLYRRNKYFLFIK